MKQQVRVSITDAPKFIAQLVREGVTFASYQDPDETDIVVINFLGGY